MELEDYLDYVLKFYKISENTESKKKTGRGKQNKELRLRLCIYIKQTVHVTRS